MADVWLPGALAAVVAVVAVVVGWATASAAPSRWAARRTRLTFILVSAALVSLSGGLGVLGLGRDADAESVAVGATPAPPQPPAEPVATSRYGPFTIPSRTAGGLEHNNIVRSDLQPPCTDCYVTEFKPDLVYEDGTSANLDTGLMLHHAVFTDPGKVDVTCGRRGYLRFAGQRFYGAGNERTVGGLPSGFGYRVGGGPWIGLFEIMNHSDAERTVYFTLTVKWRPASDAAIKPATPVWLDVENCASSEFDVAAGPVERRTSWTSTITGRVVAAAGHVHDGGVATTLRNTTSREHLCRSVAGYGTKPSFMNTVESMSVCAWDRLGVIRPGDVLDLAATYNASKPVEGAMGIMLLFVHETDDVAGGSPPPPGSTDPPLVTPPPVHLH